MSFETRPYPNEHSCRLESPDDFDKFRRENCAQKHDDKCIDVIYGIKDKKSKIQALRYPTKTWTEGSARSHCKSRDGSFEAAAKEKKEDIETVERRYFTIEELETEKRDDGQRKITGHAAVFNEVTDIFFFQEKIEPGAFKDSIKKDDVRALFNHDPSFILGRNKSGTLKLKEDDKGLAIEIYPPETQYARDLIISIDRGDISQMSFAFETVKEEWEHNKNKPDLRILKEVKLYDVSPVTYPAYKGTDVAMRSYEKFLEAEEIEEITISRKRIRKMKVIEHSEKTLIIKGDLINGKFTGAKR